MNTVLPQQYPVTWSPIEVWPQLNYIEYYCISTRNPNPMCREPLSRALSYSRDPRLLSKESSCIFVKLYPTRTYQALAASVQRAYAQSLFKVVICDRVARFQSCYALVKLLLIEADEVLPFS